MTNQLAEIKSHWFTDDQHRPDYWADLASRDVPWLIQEVERLQRFEAMWEDCRKHRKQAEGRAARYREIVQGVANLLIANEEASPP